LGEVSLVFIGYNLARCANIVDGLEKFKVLTYKYLNASGLHFRLQTAYFKLFCDIHFFQTPFFNSKIFLKMNGLDKTNIIKFSLFLTVVCGFCADSRYVQQQKNEKERTC
jgi:hypothetical protein